MTNGLTHFVSHYKQPQKSSFLIVLVEMLRKGLPRYEKYKMHFFVGGGITEETRENVKLILLFN